MADQLSLINLGGGAAVEKFQIELNRVLENLMDPNTGDGKREITLKVEFRPSRDRDACNLRVSCSSKLAAYEMFESKAYMGLGRSGKAEIYESNPAQLGLFEPPAETAANVLEMKKEKKQ